jgi:ribose 5-phosphate isomerase B
MLSLGERLLSWEVALPMITVWLETPIDGGRHIARIQELEQAH